MIQWFQSIWFGIALIVLMLIAIRWKYLKDYKVISEFDGDDIGCFRIAAKDIMATRIIKRAEAVGWELAERERAPEWNCDYLTFKAKDDAQPLSDLLKKLHRSGFSVKPQRVQLNCDGNCEKNNAKKN